MAQRCRSRSTQSGTEPRSTVDGTASAGAQIEAAQGSSLAAPCPFRSGSARVHGNGTRNARSRTHPLCHSEWNELRPWACNATIAAEGGLFEATPSGTVDRGPSTIVTPLNQAMEVGMEAEDLGPGVQDGGEPDLGLEPGLGDFGQGLGDTKPRR